MFKICRSISYYYKCRKTIDINEDLCDYIETHLAENGYTQKDGSRIEITPEIIKTAIDEIPIIGTPVFSEHSKTYVKLSNLIIDEIDDIYRDDNEHFVHFRDEDYDEIDYFDMVIGG